MVVAIIWCVAIFVLTFIVAAVARRITRRALQEARHASVLLRNFLAGLVYKIVLLVGIVVAISFLGVNIAPLVAAIGAAGLVVGLALQGTLSNFASGILILLYRPYDVGDVIKAGSVSGKVDAMSLVSTTVVTFDNQRIIVPNNSIWGDTITNQTGMPTRRVDMTFGVGYGDDLDHVMNTLAEVCREHPNVLASPEPLIKVVGHGDSAINVTCRPWVKTDDYWGVYWDFHKLVKQKFDANGINIPFPQRDVHMIRGAGLGWNPLSFPRQLKPAISPANPVLGRGPSARCARSGWRQGRTGVGKVVRQAATMSVQMVPKCAALPARTKTCQMAWL